MGLEKEVYLFLKKSFNNFDFHVISAGGNSGGLALGWNPRVVNINNIRVFDSWLGDNFFHAKINTLFTFANIYGPYNEDHFLE